MSERVVATGPGAGADAEHMAYVARQDERKRIGLSWSPKWPASRVVALWKDARRGVQELALEKDANALLLTLTAEWTTEFSADGRSDGGNAPELVLSGVEQISDARR